MPWESGATFYTYADGCKIILEGEGFESKGKVPSSKARTESLQRLRVYHSERHGRHQRFGSEPRNTDFLECVKTRQKFALEETIAPQLHDRESGSCALRLGRTLHFDPATQTFVGDDAANLLINQPMRTPWASMIL